MIPDLIEQFRITGKVAVITGASRGIGEGIAIGLADAGAHVVITARDSERLKAVEESIKERGGSCSVLVGDITEEETITQLIKHALDTYGQLDIWVSNAGTSDHPGSFAFEDFPAWHWDQQIALNLRPHFLAARACAEVMEPGSSIIGISSIAGIRPAVRFAAYGAAKAGMNNLTETLSIELASKGIRANVVSPGQVPTEATTRVGGVPPEEFKNLGQRIPIGRVGTPIDIAAAVLYLVSDAGSWVTGQNIVVDGGVT
jgi:NAD(P)-dependent dehydrogenase (short-subunit alcohol dehydrogenase family)